MSRAWFWLEPANLSPNRIYISPPAPARAPPEPLSFRLDFLLLLSGLARRLSRARDSSSICACSSSSSFSSSKIWKHNHGKGQEEQCTQCQHKGKEERRGDSNAAVVSKSVLARVAEAMVGVLQKQTNNASNSGECKRRPSCTDRPNFFITGPAGLESWNRANGMRHREHNKPQ